MNTFYCSLSLLSRGKTLLLFAQAKSWLLSTRRTLAISCAGVLLFTASLPSHAAEVFWPDHPYGLFSQGEELGNILEDFSNNYGYQSVISGQLTMPVSISLPAQDAQSFLNTLSGMYGFHWYYDGAALYFYAQGEVSTTVLRLAYLTPVDLKTSLLRSGVLDTTCRCHWRAVDEQSLVYLSGPPRMVQLVEQTVSALDMNQTADEYQIRVFKLKYSSAADIIRTQGDVIPGVVSMLRRMVEDTFEDVIIRTPAPAYEGMQSMQGIGERAANTIETATLAVPATGRQASIEADVRINAVVIYDKSNRMPMYERFIEELDKPVEQVEIQVSILNVKTETLQTLGVNWRLGGNNSEIGFGPEPGEPGQGQLGIALGATLSSGVLPSDYLLATVNALTKSGDANIISRPSVITSDNLEAQLDFTDTFYVKVTSRESAELFPVTVGAVLRITPHIVDEGHGRKNIRMNIDIQDGSETGQDINGIPTTQSTSVTTQAVVANGESIVVGGYYYDTMETGQDKVPGLHHIPVLGSIFKSKTTKSVNMSRVFMITPRILTIANTGNL